MQIFITGTDTGVGKTITCAWLCAHTSYEYIKPIQTGSNKISDDSAIIASSIAVKTYKPIYEYEQAVSPHLAAKMNGDTIDLNKIVLPQSRNLIVEGIGGVLVPINKNHFIVDVIKNLNITVILVASSRVGTINHSLLSLEILRKRNIKILGVIVNGAINQDNCDAIEYYGGTNILAQIPILERFDRSSLLAVPFTTEIKNIVKV
jgi:dethiobiotin synthetase